MNKTSCKIPYDDEPSLIIQQLWGTGCGVELPKIDVLSSDQNKAYPKSLALIAQKEWVA